MIQREIESILQFRIGLLGEECTMLRQFQHLRIVINVEMIRLEYLPVKIIILNLIVAEIIAAILTIRGGCCKTKHQRRENANETVANMKSDYWQRLTTNS